MKKIIFILAIASASFQVTADGIKVDMSRGGSDEIGIFAKGGGPGGGGGNHPPGGGGGNHPPGGGGGNHPNPPPGGGGGNHPNPPPGGGGGNHPPPPPPVVVVPIPFPGFPGIPGFPFPPGPGPGPGHPPRPPGGGRHQICFYEDVNFSGASFCVRSGDEDANLSRSGWNNRISSIRVSRGASLAVFTGNNFGGQELDIDQDVPDIRTFGWGWNDVISSYIIDGRPGHPGPGNGGGNNTAQVCYYENVNYAGASFCLGVDDEQGNLNNLGWANRISSVSVKGDASTFIYSNVNFGGAYVWINQSVSDLRNYSGGNWNDVVSSVNVLHADGQP